MGKGGGGGSEAAEPQGRAGATCIKLAVSPMQHQDSNQVYSELYMRSSC